MATNNTIRNATQYRDNTQDDSFTSQEDEADLHHLSDNEDTIAQVENIIVTQPLEVNTEKVKKIIHTHMDKMENKKADQVDKLADEMNNLKITKQTQATTSVTYLQNEEQISKLQNLEISDNLTKAQLADQLQKVLQLVIQKDDKAAKEYIEELEAQKNEHLQKGKNLQSGVSEAHKVANRYKTVLLKPTVAPAPQGVNLNPQRTSPREIISVTGKFDPQDEKADFNQLWNKLTAYGQLNYFEEDDYKTALTYILQNDAYEALTSMTDENQTLQYIIDYFAKVYGRKRSLTKDRQAVDNFSRRKNEPLEICMYRSLISIDRLRHLYSVEAWPEIRSTLRRNILTQVISEKTRRHIQIEERERG